MRVYISHEGMDFDSLAGMVAARKLHGDGPLLSLGKKRSNVNLFLKLYYKYFKIEKFSSFEALDEIDEVIMVDTRRRKRLEGFAEFLEKSRPRIIIYDHHPGGDIEGDIDNLDNTGAVTTMIVEKLLQNDVDINQAEADLFLLGIYEDTGALLYPTTTYRDVMAAGNMIRFGARPENIRSFLKREFNTLQESLYETLKKNLEYFDVNGLTVHMTYAELPEIVGGISDILGLIHVKGELGTSFAIVGMGKKVHVVGKTSTNDININQIMSYFGGGGHMKAGSATLYDRKTEDVKNELIQLLNEEVFPGIRARDIMSRPVFSLGAEERVGDVIEKILYSHYTSCPVTDADGHTAGWISKDKIMKSRKNGDLNIPIKGIMKKNLIIVPQDMPFDKIKETFFRENVSIIIVEDNDGMVGVITASDILGVLHT